MKIVLLLLSSAILAILCYAFFRNNVTDFYTFIETVEKPFNEKTFIKGFKEEAKNIGNEKAYRAVANANGKNNLSIIVPCHRVIANNGNIGGYTGGIWIKEYLLNLEKGEE